MRWLKRAGFALLVLVLLAAAGFLAWAYTPLGPMPEAMAAMQPDGQVQVDAGRWFVFRPATGQPVTGLIFYPGGRVDPRSYAPAARAIAAQGYLAVIVPMPLNLSVLGSGQAAEVMAAYPQVRQWAIGGHSLGGAMAAQFAVQHPAEVQGLVLWAAYPPGGVQLGGQALAALSAYGSEDGVVNRPNLAASPRQLPANTHWLVIEGGNHAQFGWYGPQPGDRPAAIDRAEQQARAVAATVALLAALPRSGT